MLRTLQGGRESPRSHRKSKGRGMTAPTTRQELTSAGFVLVCKSTSSGVLVEIFGDPVTGCHAVLTGGRLPNSGILDYWRASWWELPRQAWRSLMLNLKGQQCDS